jgi:hypothetical protein
MRRRPVRALLLLIFWAGAATAIWMHLLQREQAAKESASCPVPTAVSYASLESAAPVPPGDIDVAVLNATDRRGLAAEVAGSLQTQGFTKAEALGNDTLHGVVRCSGQIRFGPNGVRAARTLGLVMPCAQLVRDQRSDSSVDLVVGAAFSTLTPSPAARAVLERLQTPAGGLQSAAGLAIPSSLLVSVDRQSC